MSLLDLQQTPAWTTILVDRGPNFGARRWYYTPPAWLDNGGAMKAANQYGPTSKLYQWNGNAWADVMASRSWRV